MKEPGAVRGTVQLSGLSAPAISFAVSRHGPVICLQQPPRYVPTHAGTSDTQCIFPIQGRSQRRRILQSSHTTLLACNGVCPPHRQLSSPQTILTASSLSRTTYWDSRNRQSPALIRARRPYLVKNTLTGLALGAFTLSVCTIYVLIV